MTAGAGIAVDGDMVVLVRAGDWSRRDRAAPLHETCQCRSSRRGGGIDVHQADRAAW